MKILIHRLFDHVIHGVMENTFELRWIVWFSSVKWEVTRFCTDFNGLRHYCGENSSYSVFTSGVIFLPRWVYLHIHFRKWTVHLTWRRLSSDEDDARFSRRANLTLGLLSWSSSRKESDMGELASEEEQRWVCPNDRQLKLRAKWVNLRTVTLLYSGCFVVLHTANRTGQRMNSPILCFRFLNNSKLF